MIDTWQRAWAEFVPFLDFPVELRTIVYTTDDIVNRCRGSSGLPVGDRHLVGAFGVFDDGLLLIA